VSRVERVARAIHSLVRWVAIKDDEVVPPKWSKLEEEKRAQHMAAAELIVTLWDALAGKDDG
jgi:hypothetical protein